MQKQMRFLFPVLLCISILLSSCNRGSGSGPAGATGTPGSEPKNTVVKVIDQGRIIQKEGNRWFITAYVEKNGTPSIDAFWFTVSEKTVLQDSYGRSVPPENMAIGVQVEAWSTGAERETYPVQADAAKMILHADKQAVPAEMIGQTKAVQIALQSQTGSTVARAVKNVSLDEDKGYWQIELVQQESINKPVTVRVNVYSGQIVPIPVAENKAFRVFSPVPGSELGPAFTVEGEARVFEAAFSWTLEDGHNVLAKGNEMANGGAPAWGRFRFNVSYKKASQPNMTLILFVHSPKDGSIENELVIPLKVPKELIDYTVK